MPGHLSEYPIRTHYHHHSHPFWPSLQKIPEIFAIRMMHLHYACKFFRGPGVAPIWWRMARIVVCGPVGKVAWT